jgi:hypothetical protein
MRKRLKINRYTPAAVYLKVHTYVGSATVYWAKHWQGTLFCGEDREGIPVTYNMTQGDADKSNKDDGPYGCGGAMGAYKAGEESTRFLSREVLIAAVEACWQSHYPQAKVLIEGENCVIEPQAVLIGPKEIKDRINVLYAECEALGWWEDDHDAEVDQRVDEWMRIWKDQIEPLAVDYTSTGATP